MVAAIALRRAGPMIAPVGFCRLGVAKRIVAPVRLCACSSSSGINPCASQAIPTGLMPIRSAVGAQAGKRMFFDENGLAGA